jgi:uncharacterized protein (TIGR02466 family)
MIEHKLFPTLVGEFHYDKKNEFKKLFVDNIFKYTSLEGYSSEATGHVNLHHEEQFTDLFKFATKSAKKFVERYNIDADKFDFNIIKTWMNIKKVASTPLHAHKDAHISFTYYINMPSNCSLPIRFHCGEKYEPYAGSIIHNNSKNIWDEINSLSWTLTPIEGQMFIFNSGLAHDTIGEPLNRLESGINKQNILQHRLCLAGDIILTYKEKTASPLGIQPVSNWRNFL